MHTNTGVWQSGLHKPTLKKWALASAIAALGAVDIAPAHGALTIEEVVVTARKREESLQDVPVTVSALGEQTIDRLNLSNVQDIAALVPSFSTVSRGAGSGGSMILRGIGSNSQEAFFDSAVALNYDGVVANNSRLVRSGNLDMAQIEVLKGPQSLYFGKGASAGVVSIRSANPTDEFEAQLTGAYEFEEDATRFEGFISGPLSDNFFARLAFRTNQIDEVVKNTAPNVANEWRGEETLDARLTLVWEPSDELSVNFKYAISEYQSDGPFTRTELQCVESTPQPLVIPQAAALAGLVFLSPNNAVCDQEDGKIQVGDQDSRLAGGHPFNNGGVPFVDQNLDVSSLKIEYALTDNLNLTSLTGYIEVDETSFGIYGFDTAGSNGVSTLDTEETWSQELRLDGDLSDNVSFMLGLFYQERELFTRNVQDALGFALFANLASGAPIADPFQNGETIDWNKSHPLDAEALSVFGSLDWRITDRLTMTVGARYTDEEKTSRYTTPFIHSYILATPGIVTFSGFVSDEIQFEDDNISPELSLSYDWTDNINVYGAYKTGFKSGGISSSQLPYQANIANIGIGDLTGFVFDSEEGEGFEVGMKADLLEGDLRLNSTVYHYIYDDLQIQQFNADVFGFDTANAGEVTNYGIETDFQWSVSEAILVRGAWAYNIAEYSDEFITQPAAGGNDIDGETRSQAPKLSGNIGIDYLTDITEDLEFGVSVTAYYSGEYSLSNQDILGPDDVDEDAFWRGDIVTYISPLDGQWEINLAARNFTDERYANELTGLPAGVPNAAGERDRLLFQGAPRTVVLEFTYNF